MPVLKDFTAINFGNFFFHAPLRGSKRRINKSTRFNYNNYNFNNNNNTRLQE